MTTPHCLVIIPDGNRRWAKLHNHTRAVGHTRGLQNLRTITTAAFAAGVDHVVLWAASESNLAKRDPEEVAHIFALLKRELMYRSRKDSEAAFHLCGARKNYTTDSSLSALVEKAQSKTAHHNKQLTILFGYSGTTEVVEAAQKAAQEGLITTDSIHRHLWTRHVPKIDLVIRTGVENDPHWSDLLLPWQIQNAQLYFSEKHWPEFSTGDLNIALKDFETRNRRAGS